MPRIVVVIDEFQVLFEEDDELTRESLLNLERLSRKGRAYGIHLVLASQTLSGITALLAKQDGIFSQFPIRLALKNSAPESRAVLDQNNAEAARLRYRGEVIVNSDFGQLEGNRRAVVALAEPEELARLRVELWRLAGNSTLPQVFNGALPGDLIAAVAGHSSGYGADEPSALLGLPVAVSQAPVGIALGPNSGRHLSVIGAGQSVVDRDLPQGIAILQTAAVSLAIQHRARPARFILLDLTAKSRGHAAVSVLARALRDLGQSVELVADDGLVRSLSALSAEIVERRSGANVTDPVYIIGLGMDRAPYLRAFDLTTGGAPIDSLHTLWREGAQLGMHVLGWWTNFRTYQDQLGLEASGMVDATAVLRVSSQDVLDLFGPFVSWNSPENRMLVKDVAELPNAQVIVPFSPLTEHDLARLTSAAAVQ